MGSGRCNQNISWGERSIVYIPTWSGSGKIVAGTNITEATTGSDEKRDPVARGRNRRGYELAEDGRYDEALACFKWVIENYPDTQDALFALDNLVETYWRAKRGKEAFDYLQLVLKAHPNSELGALAQEFTIRNYVTDGDYEGAIRVARDLLERFPGRERNKWVEYQIGLIYELADGPTQARAALF